MARGPEGTQAHGWPHRPSPAMCHQSTHCHPPTPRMTETHWQRGCLGSNSPFGHGSPWMVLFLAVHLFTSCFPLTEAQDGGDDATTGPPDSPAPTSPTKKLPPPSPPLLTTKKVLAALRLTTKKATTSPLVASTWTPDTPFGSAAISNPYGSGYPYAPAVPLVPITITMEPNNSRLGGDVTLIPGGDMTGIASCTWYRGDEMTSVPIMTYKLPPVSTIENNVSYSGREMVGKDCSLHIEHLTLGDSAIYTLRTAGDTKFGEGKINVKIIGIDPEGKKAEGLSVEAIAGITGGALGVVLILGILALCLMTTTVSHAPTAVAPVQSEVATASKRSPQRGKRSSKKPIRRNKNVSKGRGPPVPGRAK